MASPVIFKICFTGSNGFQTDSSNLSCKLLEAIINSRQGLSRNNIHTNSETNSGSIFRIRYSFGPDSKLSIE